MKILRPTKLIVRGFAICNKCYKTIDDYDKYRFEGLCYECYYYK